MTMVSLIFDLLKGASPLLLKYWKVSLCAVLVLGSFAGGYYTSSKFRDADEKDLLSNAIDERDKAVSKNRDLSEKVNQLEADLDKEKNKGIREVIKYVKSKPELDDCKLDADGLRLWNNIH
jgi:hypothetical protein